MHIVATHETANKWSAFQAHCDPSHHWMLYLQPENNLERKDSLSLLCITEAPVANEYY